MPPRDWRLRVEDILDAAAGHLSRAQEEVPCDIPWTDVSGMRHILIHEYFGVDLGIVWQTITVDLPLLRATLSPLTRQV